MWPFTRARENRELRILVEFMTTTEELSAFDLQYITKIPMVVLNKTLARMEADGRLTSRYAEPTEQRAWLRRRLYRINTLV